MCQKASSCGFVGTNCRTSHLSLAYDHQVMSFVLTTVLPRVLSELITGMIMQAAASLVALPWRQVGVYCGGLCLPTAGLQGPLGMAHGDFSDVAYWTFVFRSCKVASSLRGPPNPLPSPRSSRPQSESAVASAPLPRPLIPGNADAVADMCMVGDKLQRAVRSKQVGGGNSVSWVAWQGAGKARNGGQHAGPGVLRCEFQVWATNDIAFFGRLCCVLESH